MNIKILLTFSMVLLFTACTPIKNESAQHSFSIPLQPLKWEKIQLSADVLFGFNEYRIEDIRPEGISKLDRLAEGIISGYAKIEEISITGHTDRLGREHYNYDLGLKRADSIRQYLYNKGIKEQINTFSVGSKQPITNQQDCAGKIGTSLQSCLVLDRRVIIDIKGVKKVFN